MGNARSASYSYHHPLEQQEERHRSLPSPLQHHHAESSPHRHHPPYWDGNTSALPDTAADEDGADSVLPPVLTSAAGGEEPPPLPFVRHRNAPIRLPRININNRETCWPRHQQQPFGYSLNSRRGRHKSLSCSMMVHSSARLPSQSSNNFISADKSVDAGRCDFVLMGNEGESSSSRTTVPPASALSSDEDADKDGRLRGAVSCAALLLQCDPAEARNDRSTAGRQPSPANNNNRQPTGCWITGQAVSNPFKRQFLSMRVYHDGSRHHQRRPLLLLPRSNSSVRPSPSISVPVLTELDGSHQFQQVNVKVRNYLETARLKKQSVEQSIISQTRLLPPDSADSYYALNLLQPSPSPSALPTEGEDPVQLQQQLDEHQKTGLDKSWTSISQESLGVGGEEDEDGGYTTTLTVGDNGSLRSRYSDSSYLTLLTANTSLSSGYHGPGSLGGPVSSSSSCSEEEPDSIVQRQQMVATQCDGTTSGLFYLEWLRQVTGTVPPYVELRQGRLHLKLIQGQSVRRSLS